MSTRHDDKGYRRLMERAASVLRCSNHPTDLVLAKEISDALSVPSAEQHNEGYPGIAHDLETMRTALRKIAITDDADCAHAASPAVMTKIARDALRSVK